jgi:hypothetical protein
MKPFIGMYTTFKPRRTRFLENSEEPTLPSSSAFQLRSDYQNLMRKAERLFPKVGQTLLMDMLKLETKQRDWQGTVVLEIRYSGSRVSLDEKINKLYNKYERVPSEKDDRTLRFKAVHIDKRGSGNRAYRGLSRANPKGRISVKQVTMNHGIISAIC